MGQGSWRNWGITFSIPRSGEQGKCLFLSCDLCGILDNKSLEIIINKSVFKLIAFYCYAIQPPNPFSWTLRYIRNHAQPRISLLLSTLGWIFTCKHKTDNILTYYSEPINRGAMILISLVNKTLHFHLLPPPTVHAMLHFIGTATYIYVPLSCEEEEGDDEFEGQLLNWDLLGSGFGDPVAHLIWH